tara:strand:+ start:1120 stop:6009 length:4890 start_codon:yes stop_codon:yes gene_type:complete
MENNAELICPHDLSSFQFESSSDDVSRSSMLDTIDMHYTNGECSIAVHGQEGMGKSTLLYQFLNRYKNNAIGLFLNAINGQSYALDNIVIDLYRQASWVLNGEEPSGFENASKRDLAKVFYLLDIYLKKNQKFVYLIIDGLSDIPKRDHYVVDSVVDILPFSAKNIKILISIDDEEGLKKLVSRKLKRMEMLVFSEYEAQLLLPAVEREAIDSLIRVFPAVPGNLKIIKRLICSGMTADEILQDYSSSSDSKDLYDAEWNRSKISDEQHRQILAVAAFSISPINISTLAELFYSTEDDVFSVASRFGFLSVKSGVIYFASKGMKLFVREQLKKLEEQSLSLIVDYYQRNPDTEASLSEINIYNDKLGRYKEIIGQLSNDNIHRLFKKSKSLNEAIKQIKLGRHAADEMLSMQDTLRLSHAESILSGLRTSNHLDSELRCYLADGDLDSALALISEAEFVEERLQLLAAIASHQKKKSDRVDENIEIRINEDFKKVNPENMGIERTTDLASELFVAFPEMALSLINQIDSLDQSGGNKSDYALFRLSMNMVRKNDGSIEALTENVESLEDKKKEALSMLGLFKKGTPAEKIISKIDEFPEPSDSIFVLRHWIRSFPKDENVHLLIKKLLSLIISTTDYHANASVYADISTALQYMHEENGKDVLRQIDSELYRLKRVGPSIDFVRLQCHLILFDEKFSMPGSRVSELEEYLCSEIDDLSTKLSSFSIVQRYSEKSEKLSLICDFPSKKNEIFSELIENCADHIALIRDALEREVSLSFENALSWALRLNTRPRRDYALSLVIKEACKLGLEESPDRLCQEVKKIKNIEYRNDAFHAVFRSISERENVSKNEIKRLIKARNRIKDSFVVCDLNLFLLVAIKKVNVDCSDQREAIIDDLNESFKKIEGNWLKIDVAYKVYSRLSTIDDEVAKLYRGIAIELRRSDLSHNDGVVNSHVLAVDLVLRSFYFLCKQDLEDDDSFSQICSCIESIPSKILRIKQWARLGSCLRLTDKSKYERQLIEEHLIQDYDTLGEEISKEFSVSSYWALPILFKYSKTSFERKMGILSKDEYLHDEIISATQRFILNKVLLGDPFEPVKKIKYSISNLDIEDYVSLVGLIKEESRLFFAARELVNIMAIGGKGKYSKVQINLVSDLLLNLIENKFDGVDNIKHCGYKICCTALFHRLNGVKSQDIWEKLVKWVDDVPVKSDKVFVFGQLIESMPSSLLERKRQLLFDSVEIVDSLKCGYERISRFEYLADVGVDIDKAFVKKFVERAVLLSTNDESEEFEEKRLRLIDSLYSMDKDFASSLSAMVDDDPARKSIIEENVQRKNKERIEKEEFDVLNDQIQHDTVSSKYPRMLWSLLGKLNANNHLPNKRSDYQKFLNSVSQYSFEQAYPMLSYFIHARAVSSQTKQQTKANIKPIFDILVNGIYLFRGICALDEDKNAKVSKDDESIVFGEGESDAVLDFVKAWISNNADDRLVIIDPYFGLGDLEFIGSAINKDPDFEITILTSYSNLKAIAGNEDSDPDDEINRFWRENISSDSTPKIDVIFCGLPSLKNEMPVHDRWWLSNQKGLDFGGSLNGIGGKRISSISVMNNQEVVSVEHRMDGFLDRSQRSLNGERIKYQVVSV